MLVYAFLLLCKVSTYILRNILSTWCLCLSFSSFYSPHLISFSPSTLYLSVLSSCFLFLLCILHLNSFFLEFPSLALFLSLLLFIFIRLCFCIPISFSFPPSFVSFSLPSFRLTLLYSFSSVFSQ